MSGNREICPLTDIVFESLLKFRSEITPDTESQFEVLMQYKFKKEAAILLQSIANGDVNAFKEAIADNTELLLASSSVTIPSGMTYKNVTPIQLAYFMDDIDFCQQMLPYIKALPPDKQAKIYQQLSKELAISQSFCVQFQPFDFSDIATAITDEMKIDSPGNELKNAFETFKNSFKECLFKSNKSFIKEHLQAALITYIKNWVPWNPSQLRWYLIHVIGYIQSLAEACFEQECKQGLVRLVTHEESLTRDGKLQPYYNIGFILHPESALGRDYYINMSYGVIDYYCISCTHAAELRALIEKFCQQKNQAMAAFANTLQQLVAASDSLVTCSNKNTLSHDLKPI